MADNLHIKIEFFGFLQASLGQKETMLEIASTISVGELLDRLKTKHCKLQKIYDDKNIVTIVNQTMSEEDTPVNPGDHVVLMVPLSGG